MTQANEILKMIEAVDPKDTANMDEIDARVWAYLKLPNDGLKISFNGGGIYYRYAAWPEDAHTILHHPFQRSQYTRSRDALKAIRPESNFIDICPKIGRRIMYFAKIHRREYREDIDGELRSYPMRHFSSEYLATEELAELHAIIQAIEHDRKNPV